MEARFLGIDFGAETVKLVELVRSNGRLEPVRRELVDHDQRPVEAISRVLSDLHWGDLSGCAVTGRFAGLLRQPRVPGKRARTRGFRYLFDDDEATIVSIGGHGFSVLELRASGVEILRPSSRCSQGTGSFLDQLVRRFDLTVEEAAEACAEISDPAPLSGRCPVILKTDMTHLANAGESRARILAGLFDAVCENVQALLKPRVIPRRLLLSGGVTRAARVLDSFSRFAERHALTLLPRTDDDHLYIDAFGCAVIASEGGHEVAPLSTTLIASATKDVEREAALSSSLGRVQRRRAAAPEHNGDLRPKVVLGFDIGSTGAKAVALAAKGHEVRWESYVDTRGDPVGAACELTRRFLDGPAGEIPVIGLGVTGSGREIVGSLLASLHGPARIEVVNEIAAHARGAVHHEPRVDTIFEIGGQDAKYIRLSEGRIVDATMNEACSAGTGSFIEEQGRCLVEVGHVGELAEVALAADGVVVLGQHCSVFMAEVIQAALASGAAHGEIIAGIYDAVILNYLNRVKGPRSVGEVIFCQGMPFSSDALAAAVARHTGSEVIVPPSPGTVGALGIALLADFVRTKSEPLDLRRVLSARVDKRDTFICRSTSGCGGVGNRCRIDRLHTSSNGQKRQFTWGGGCSLWERRRSRSAVAEHAPDVFREREVLVGEVLAGLIEDRGRRRVAVSGEFILKDLIPFFATFLHELGVDLVFAENAGQSTLKRGIGESNVAYCAPMQLYHGVISELLEQQPDFVFAPMVRGLERCGSEVSASACPIVQGGPDMLRWNFEEGSADRWITPVIDMGPGGLDSKELKGACRRIARQLGASRHWRRAHDRALGAQRRFRESCLDLGRRALEHALRSDLIPVVVLGRPYTIYNPVLNSNVPTILREHGAVAIPVDCYPIEEPAPVFADLYWAFGQRSLRAATQIRKANGVYSLWCSNYSCGPDSFNLHFYSYLMAGKPFTVIETDGHSGDAGTKTRVEAFLHCAHADRVAGGPPRQPNPPRLLARSREVLVSDVAEEVVLFPAMGPNAEILAAGVRGLGVRSEKLPLPDREALELGRRHTSGKECLPVTITLGSLLQRLQREDAAKERFAFFMPASDGPCRFGMYNIFDRLLFRQLGLEDQVRILAPHDEGLFDCVSASIEIAVFAGVCCSDALLQALFDVRPSERQRGATDAIYDRWFRRLSELVEASCRSEPTLAAALRQVLSGELFGCAELLGNAAQELRAAGTGRQAPRVMVVGEIYVRHDPFANGFVIDELEKRGIGSQLAPLNELLEYLDWTGLVLGGRWQLGRRVSSFVKHRIQDRCHDVAAAVLGWPTRPTTRDILRAANTYVREELIGEAILTVGAALDGWRAGLIDGVISTGPLECLPTKVAEAQLFHAAEHEGLLSLTLPMNGEPLDSVLLDTFAFEVHERFQARRP